jgi:CHASE2 domain-containing sensor protein
MKKNTLKQALWGVIIAVALAVVVTVLLLFGVFRDLELKSLDTRYKNRGPMDVSQSKLIIIAIDDQTFKSCRDRYPYHANITPHWSKTYRKSALRRLCSIFNSPSRIIKIKG